MRLIFILCLFALLAPAAARASDFLMPGEKKDSSGLTMDEFATVKPGLLLVEESPKQSDDQQQPTTVGSGQTITQKLLTFDEILREYVLGNYSQILPSLSLLVNNGRHDAEELLGIMYKSGFGVEKDATKGFELLSKAADANRALAQHHLGVMYFTGEGVEPDQVTSLMWLHVAIAHYPDGPEKARAIKDRENVLARLSRREKERARELARDWLARKGEAHLIDAQ
jgi:TPR repeat protein